MISGDYQIQFQDYYTGDFITLGGDQTYCSVRFEGLGTADLQTAERNIPGEDGGTFGPEFLGMRRWTINGAVKPGTIANAPGSPSAAWDAMSKLQRAWDYNTARTRSREVVPLYFKRPGRETVLIYGRPERIDPATDISHAGYITYSALFRQSDPIYYGETENLLTIQLQEPYSGGLMLNVAKNAFISPFTTSAAIFRQGSSSNAGDGNSHGIYKINGPVTNPQISMKNNLGATLWTTMLKTTLLSGQTATIDTRLWKRSVLRNDGGSLAGTINGPSLGSMIIPPGNVEFIYSGQDPTGSTSCEIRFRNAWTSL